MTARILDESPISSLMATFHFTQTDLDANRRNILTDEQRDTAIRSALKSQVRAIARSLSFVVPLVILMPLIDLFLRYFFYFLFQFYARSPTFLLEDIGVFLIVVIVHLPGVFQMMLQVDKDLASGLLARMNGKLYIRPRPIWGRMARQTRFGYPLLEVNGLSISIDSKQARALSRYENQPVMIYYLINSKIIVAVEPC